MSTLSIQGKEKIFFGKSKIDGDSINMDKPSFDCGWYWSFGSLGNKGCHYHLSGYQKENGFGEHRDINMYDSLMSDYDLNPCIKANLWSFCEQSQTIYTIKEAFEVFNRGGANYTENPMSELIKMSVDAEKLNKELLPELLQKFWNDFGGNCKELELPY